MMSAERLQTNCAYAMHLSHIPFILNLFPVQILGELAPQYFDDDNVRR